MLELKELHTQHMDVLESIPTGLDSTETGVYLMKIQEDTQVNYYIVQETYWSAPDSLFPISEKTYEDLKATAKIVYKDWRDE